jgi:hypothetical protein
LAWGLFIGCGKSGPTSTPSADGGGKTTASAAPTVNETDPSSSPIAKAAYDFVDAIVKGDTQRASARLTPQAMQRIIASKEQFAPTGLSTATFKLGAIRTPSPEQAVVQCVLTDSSQGTPQSEEMCCVLRKVENDWRVAGIAYGTSPDKPWVLNDFESGKSFAIPRQAMGSGMATTQGNGQQPATGVVQVGATQPPAEPPQGPTGMPPVATQYNAPVAGPGPNGLGMPAVASPAANVSPYQTPAPYTAQEPAATDRR